MNAQVIHVRMALNIFQFLKNCYNVRVASEGAIVTTLQIRSFHNIGIRDKGHVFAGKQQHDENGVNFKNGLFSRCFNCAPWQLHARCN